MDVFAVPSSGPRFQERADTGQSPASDAFASLLGELKGNSPEVPAGRPSREEEPEELAADGGYLQDRDFDPFGPVTVPDGEYFMLGDWRTNSGDSRFQLGTIPEEDITGFTRAEVMGRHFRMLFLDAVQAAGKVAVAAD